MDIEEIHNTQVSDIISWWTFRRYIEEIHNTQVSDIISWWTFRRYITHKSQILYRRYITHKSQILYLGGHLGDT